MTRKLLLTAALGLLVAGGALAQGPNQPDMQTIHKLFADSSKITRTVKNLLDGVETLTESSDPKVAALLKEHTAAMKRRLEQRQPMRMWDPLFAVLFANADKVTMTIQNTPKGVKIIERSTDSYTVKLLQSHAQAVSGFVHDGMSGMHVRHPAPPKDGKAAPADTGFLGKGDGQKTCPVTGETVDPKQTITWKGKTIRFCCPSCVAAFKNDPERYLK